MTGRRAACLVVLALVPAAAEAGVLAAWTKRLRATGAARAELRQITAALPGIPAETTRCRVWVEPPARLRFERADGGLVLTLREDGGELVDRGTQTFYRLPPDQPRREAGAWSLLLGERRGLSETPVGRGQARLEGPLIEGEPPVTVRVTIGSDSMPRAIEIAGEPSVRLEFLSWRFTRRAGAERFRQSKPAGYFPLPDGLPVKEGLKGRSK